MKRSALVLALLVLSGWPTASIAGDWYVHRTNHQMNVPPWYCYCYRVAKESVLPGTVSYPMDMQISREQAFAKMAQYATLADTCSNNCGFGEASTNQPSGACQELAKYGGCAGFCQGMGAGQGGGVSLDQCIQNCIRQYGCDR